MVLNNLVLFAINIFQVLGYRSANFMYVQIAPLKRKKKEKFFAF